jgi:hypothetical protein
MVYTPKPEESLVTDKAIVVDRHKGHWEERQFIPDAPDAAPSPFDNIGLIAVGVFAVIGCLIGVSIGAKEGVPI